MSLGLSLECDAILTRLEVGRLCSAPDDLLKRDAAYSSSSYTGRIQKSEVRRERVSSSVRAMSSASDVPMTPRSDDNAKGSSDDSSDVSDLEKFEEAYTDFGALTDGVDPQTLERDGSGHPNDEVPGIDLPGGMETLYSLDLGRWLG